jgi:acyl-CoA thioesterase FadM
MSHTFSTSSAESNLVGNIYYSHYYHWTGRLIDRYFHAIAPELFTAEGHLGEFRCVRSRVRHLREAMPFDSIDIVMALHAVYARGIQLRFDFYKLGANGQRIKLAFGDYEGIWTAAGRGAEPSEMPDLYRATLLGASRRADGARREDHVGDSSAALVAG